MKAFALALAACLQPPALPSVPFTEFITEQSLGDALRLLPPKRSGWSSDEHVAGLIYTQALLTEKVTAIGYTPSPFPVRWSRRSDSMKLDWFNIVFEQPGTGPLAREVIIVGAHFDAVPTSPGADDNATGTAALLEIARVLKDRPHQRTIRYVLFNLEEAGLIGAQQYAKHVQQEVKDKTIDVALMLSLEMLGYYSDKPDSQKNPFKNVAGAPQRTVGDFVALCGSSRHKTAIAALDAAMHNAQPSIESIRVDMFPNEQLAFMPPDLLRSDHAPFLLLGMPAIMVTDTSEFRNANYHKATDTLDTIDMPMFTRTVRALAGAIDTLAGAPGVTPPVLASPESDNEDVAPKDKPQALPEPKPGTP